MTLADRLLARRVAAGDVGPATEGERALTVPTANPPSDSLLVEVLDRVHRNGGERADLRPVQLEALAELRRAGGLLGSIGVGHGKTLIALLAPTVLGAERPVLLCPPGLIEVALEEAARFGRAFTIRGDLTIVPYSLLSRPEHAEILDQIAPDLIIADEAHHLRHLTSARTKRVLRYLAEHPRCRFVALSGTLTSRSVRDFAHLAEAALEERSPVPRHGADLAAWSAVLDADGDPLPRDWQAVAALTSRFCDYHTAIVTRGGKSEITARGRARLALRRRLASAAGVVLTEDSSTGCSLVIRRVLEPEPPPAIQELMTQVDAEGATPDGERVFATDEEASACKRRLALGFWYSWDWRGAPEAEREIWLQARSAYYSGLRVILAMDLPGLDSPARVEAVLDRAIVRLVSGRHDFDEELPDWFVGRAHDWREKQSLASPRTITQWADPWLVNDAVRWLAEQTEPAILWYRDRAFGAALAERGINVRGEGDLPPATPGPCALSIAAQGQGFNLQGWHVQRVVGCPSSGKAFEQLLGRTHRAGQLADVVACDVYLHHTGERRAFARALADAQYVEQSTGQRQKLLLARVVDARGGVNTL